MEDESGRELKDYKFFCFDGVAKFLFVASDRLDPKVETKFDFFDMEFKHLPIKHGHPNAMKEIESPKNLEKMKRIVEKLSKDIPHVRVDLYNINGKIYFGEMTFYHWGGMMPFEPEDWDYTIGSWINLEKAYGKQTSNSYLQSNLMYEVYVSYQSSNENYFDKLSDKDLIKVNNGLGTNRFGLFRGSNLLQA